ncbi:retrotransposable element Tf2 [Tanacetum coccineum]
MDRSLATREAIIDLLKFHLKRAQNRMKMVADKRRIKREFMVSDWVYLKLQPYRKHTLRKNKQHKLSQKYYGPFRILAKVGKVSYKLELPDNAQIHPVSHVSQLKAHRGETPLSPGNLPHCNNEGLIAVEPYAILDKRMAKKGNAAAVYVLVQWLNGTIDDATWEL